MGLGAARQTLQKLVGLRVLLSSALRSADRETLARAASEALGEIRVETSNLRHLIAELRPAALDELGLEAALVDLCDRAAATSGAAVSCTVELDGDALPPELECTVYRVAQEALTNTRKHSEGEHAALDVRRRDGTVEIEVTDDGRGFDPAAEHDGFRAARDAGARRVRRREARGPLGPWGDDGARVAAAVDWSGAQAGRIGGRPEKPADDHVNRVTSLAGASAPGRVPRRTNSTGATPARAIAARVSPRPSALPAAGEADDEQAGAREHVDQRLAPARLGKDRLRGNTRVLAHQEAGIVEHAADLAPVLGPIPPRPGGAAGRPCWTRATRQLERRPVVLLPAERDRTGRSGPGDDWSSSRATSTPTSAAALLEHGAHVALAGRPRPAAAGCPRGARGRRSSSAASSTRSSSRPCRGDRDDARRDALARRARRAARSCSPPPRAPFLGLERHARRGGARGRHQPGEDQLPRRLDSRRAAPRSRAAGGAQRRTGSNQDRVLGNGDRGHAGATRSRPTSSSSSSGAPKVFFGSSRLSAGPAMNVVTSAMITSIANRASEITPFSSARFRTISSVSPRVFISVPMTVDARQSKPGQPRGDQRAHPLADDRDAISTPVIATELRPVEQPDVRAQPGEREEQRAAGGSPRSPRRGASRPP